MRSTNKFKIRNLSNEQTIIDEIQLSDGTTAMNIDDTEMIITTCPFGTKQVELQKKAIASGELSPAMDPLHRRFMLPKTDISTFSHHMEQNVRLALKNAHQKQPPHFNTIIQNDTLGWGIQVGAFRSKQNAQQMAERAFDLLKTPSLKIATRLNESLFKDQLTGFSDKGGAIQACHYLNQQNLLLLLLLLLYHLFF